mmetsp:Transcript_18679/g.30477  ORF Transcript_18679/g.30477 Transcript_18679/m.30477 type:complete len:144 (+) Transcript_18679:40-471(+)
MSVLSDPANGATVFGPTSFDPAHEPENVILRGQEKFWITTGLFPQELIIKLTTRSDVERVKIVCTNVKKVKIQLSNDRSSPNSWEDFGELDLSHTDGRLQMESCSGHSQATFVKVQICEGWDDFCTVHRIEVVGDQDGNESKN